jgi:hypothetical protein
MNALIGGSLAGSKRITGSIKLTICMAVIIGLASTGSVSAVPTLVVTLTGDTAAGGSGLLGGPLVTSAGNITYVGEFKFGSSDSDFTTAGASGNTFNIVEPGDLKATLSFGFDVHSLNFIYGGNTGDMDIKAYDIGGNAIPGVSFYQGDTSGGQFAGPVTLTRTVSTAIRSVTWTDTKSSIGYLALDNIKVYIDPIPAPGALMLAGIGVGCVSRLRKRNTA